MKTKTVKQLKRFKVTSKTKVSGKLFVDWYDALDADAALEMAKADARWYGLPADTQFTVQDYIDWDTIKRQLDWVDESDPTGKLTANAYQIEVKVIAEKGPGGGWPLLEFSGPASNMRTFLANYTEAPDEEEVL